MNVIPDEMNAAERLVEEGNAFSTAGDPASAERAYRSAAALAPEWSVPLYDLGLLFKYQGRWEESLEFNRRASELAPDDQGAWWNRGIAATALGRWSEARRVWEQCGVKDPGGPDPPDYRLGRTAVRLDPGGAGEVVWGPRLDPARVRLTNVPLPSSIYRWGDIVLHDGAGDGHRIVDGRKYLVFNVLERLVPSPIQTFIVELASVNDAAVEALSRLAADMGGAAETGGRRRASCAADCSFGVPHEHDAPGGHPLIRIVDWWRRIACGPGHPGPMARDQQRR